MKVNPEVHFRYILFAEQQISSNVSSLLQAGHPPPGGGVAEELQENSKHLT
jgi:hypothetical protein